MLTKEEINRLPAGEQINGQIRRLMGQRVPGGAHGGVVEPSGRLRPGPWDPSSDPACAGDVVSYLQAAKGFDFSKSGDEEHGYTATFGYETSGIIKGEATAETLELAICRAALKGTICPFRAQWVVAMTPSARAQYRCLQCGRGWDPDEYPRGAPPPEPHFEGNLGS